MENDYKPVFTFDLARSHAQPLAAAAEGEEAKAVFEITETKKKVVVGAPPASKLLKFAAETEAEMNKWIELVNGAVKKPAAAAGA